MARIDTCPNCGYQRQIKVILSKLPNQPKLRQTNGRRWLHSTTPGLIGYIVDRFLGSPPDEPEENEPDYVEWYWRTPFTNQLFREKLDGVRPSEILLMAEALNQNEWKWSRNALRKQGRFTDTRAFELGQKLNEARLRTVDGQNQSHLAPHFLGYLYHVFSERHTSNNGK